MLWGWLAVIEAHGIKNNFALCHGQRFCIRHVAHQAIARNGMEAVLNNADIFEEARHFPDDPLGHGFEAKREAN